ncbi:hypothetical protein BDV96DRAFT_654306 [Lophiotrema nucula]|uniref:Uncharacterized protein n=1 Tax=Lophiotrema nucula TaxID=690887 RepID=A0A6A5YIR2_9PLEO|nr:hypothetical protein BDV96DRAFT_654306 [Lophiotrema nucula]
MAFPILTHAQRVSILVCILFSQTSDALQAEICLPDIQSMLTKGSGHYDPSWFFRGGTNPANPIPTLPGCRKLCEPPGSKPWHYDAGQRVTAWLLPIVVLIANLDVSPLYKWRYIEVAHVLGDPIQSFWTMLSKIEVWKWCARVSAVDNERFSVTSKELGTVLAAIEEILGPNINPLEALDELVMSAIGRASRVDSVLTLDPAIGSKHSKSKSYPVRQRSGSSSVSEVTEFDVNVESREHVLPGSQEKLGFEAGHPLNEGVVTALREAAFAYADSRTNDILRTVFAVLLYVLSFIGAYVNAVGGGNNSPPAGRVALAIFLSWIIPVVLLSNTVGGFASRRTCFTILKGMVGAIRAAQAMRNEQRGDKLSLAHLNSTLIEETLNDPSAFLKNQRWSGGSDVYRLQKKFVFLPHARRSSLLKICFFLPSYL